MKVRPIGDAESAEGWFRPDSDLDVLAIYSNANDGTKFLLWSKIQDAVAMFPAKDFEVIDGSLSPYWRGTIDLNGFVELAPQKWLVEGFWERYHDDDPEAVRIFRELSTKIEQS